MWLIALTTYSECNRGLLTDKEYNLLYFHRYFTFVINSETNNN